MSIRFASAPGCWGVEDPKNPYIPSWERVLDEAVAAGYEGMELGPYGYFPMEAEVLVPALQKRGLTIIGGTLFDDYTRAENLPVLLKKTEDICKQLSGLPRKPADPGRNFAPPYLVIIDIIKPERSPYAGNPDKAPRLSDADWQVMIHNIVTVAKLAWDKYKIRPVVHPHAGGYIEFADEINKFIQDVPYEIVGLALDTGHLYYSRMDPVTWLRDKYDRIDFIHFKDIDLDVYQRVIAEETDFFDACAQKVMCPIGKGIVDYAAVGQFLKDVDYHGWITLEQERDPRDSDTSLHDIKESLDTVKSKIFPEVAP